MGPAEQGGTIEVRVACSPARGVAEEQVLRVAVGATALDALKASGVLERHPGIDLSRQAVGVWGARRALDCVLTEGDRVEVYRALEVDPMQARRRREREQADATCSRRK